MANIYISHTSKDRELTMRIAAGLREAGQTVFIDFAELVPGDEWRSTLANALGHADVILALITPNSENSKWMMSEIGAVRAYQQVRERPRLIPVVVGDATLPGPIADVQAIISEDGDVVYIVNRVLEVLTRMASVDAAKQVERKEIQQRLELTASDYIQDALVSLGVRESLYRWTGLAWYIAGFLALISGIWTAVILSRDAMARLTGPNDP